MDKGKFINIWRRGYEDVWEGLKFWVCGIGGLWIIAEVEGVGVKSGNKTKSLIKWVGLARFAEISAPLVKHNKNQLCNYMTAEQGRLAGIPVLWCWDPG